MFNYKIRQGNKKSKGELPPRKGERQDRLTITASPKGQSVNLGYNLNGGGSLRDHLPCLHECLPETDHSVLRAYFLLRLPPQRHSGTPQLSDLPPAFCLVAAISRRTPSKLKTDHTLATFIDYLRKAQKRSDASKP